MIRKEEIQVSKNINNFLTSNNIKQTTLASQLKINRSSLHNYCHGVLPNSLGIMIKLSKHFNISLDQLVFGPSENSESSSFPTDQSEVKYEIIIKKIQ